MADDKKKSNFLKFLDKSIAFLKKLYNVGQIKFVVNLIMLVFFYGLIICFTLSRFIQFQFNIGNIVACGIAAYIIKEELPRILFKAFRA